MEGDFALLKLDRPVEKVKPLEVASLNEAQANDPVAVLGYPLGLPFMYTPGGRVLSKDKNFLRVDTDAWKNNSGSALFNIRTGKVEGILTNSKRGLSFSKRDGCRLSLNNPQDDHVTLVNRLQRIPSQQKKLVQLNQDKGILFKNDSNGKVNISLKMRSVENNDWITLNFSLASDQASKRYHSMNNDFFIHVETNENRKIIRGKDFFGFPDSPQGRELGYKKVRGQKEEILLK